MLTLISWLRSCLSGFCTVKLLVSLLFILYCLEGSLFAQLTRKERGLCSTSLRAEYLHRFFGILLHGRFVSSSPFINFVNHLYQGGFIDICFILWAIMQYHVIHCIVAIVPALAFRSSLHLVPCGLWTCPQIVGDVCFFSTHSLSGCSRCFRHILCISCISPRISHFSMESWILWLENVLETTNWVLCDCVFCY